jgi:DNA-binding NtrC family response regulator
MTEAHPPSAILIVDDEPLLLQALKRALREENYTVHTATSCGEAIAMLPTTSYSVVISDFNMPGMSGEHLLEIVRDKYPHCLRVMMSGATDARSVPDSISDGILHCEIFVSKPWHDDDLRTLIRQCIAEYEVRIKTGVSG